MKVADEVWITTAILHRENPRKQDFTVQEIVRRAKLEEMTPTHRAGVSVHVYLQCVANRPPNPARYRMLLETAKSRRRLFRTGDPFHIERDGSKTKPSPSDIPPKYHYLLEWYDSDYNASEPQKQGD